jgi:hypothetical protein
LSLTGFPRIDFQAAEPVLSSLVLKLLRASSRPHRLSGMVPSVGGSHAEIPRYSGIRMATVLVLVGIVVIEVMEPASKAGQWL